MADIKIALVGAGGKMGSRISPNLKKFGYDFVGCEKDEQGLEALRAKGLTALPTEQGVREADVVVFAIPDAAIPKLSQLYVPLMKSGATAIILDPAAARMNKVTTRDDCAFIVVHPCHPSLYVQRDTQEEKDDLFGG